MEMHQLRYVGALAHNKACVTQAPRTGARAWS